MISPLHRTRGGKNGKRSVKTNKQTTEWKKNCVRWQTRMGPYFFITCKLNADSGVCFTDIMDFIRKQSEPFKIKWFFLFCRSLSHTLTLVLSSKIRFRSFYSSHFAVSFVEYFNGSLSSDPQPSIHSSNKLPMKDLCYDFEKSLLQYNERTLDYALVRPLSLPLNNEHSSFIIEGNTTVRSAFDLGTKGS